MFLDTFNYDGQGATIVDKKTRKDDSGNTIERVVLDNGVVFVYTITNNGFERLDTNYVLVKNSNDYYYSDTTESKEDFNDYF